MKSLGFTPVGPDEAVDRYDRRTAEVVNARHGSLRGPRFGGKLADGSPLARMLDQFPALRADMRFREDGLHAVWTIQRKSQKAWRSERRRHFQRRIVTIPLPSRLAIGWE